MVCRARLALAAALVPLAAGAANGTYALTFSTESVDNPERDRFYSLSVGAGKGQCSHPAMLGRPPQHVVNSGVHLRDAGELLLLSYLKESSQLLSELRYDPATAKPILALPVAVSPADLVSTYGMIYDTRRKAPVFFDLRVACAVRVLDVPSGNTTVLAPVRWDSNFGYNMQSSALDADGQKYYQLLGMRRVGCRRWCRPRGPERRRVVAQQGGV